MARILLHCRAVPRYSGYSHERRHLSYPMSLASLESPAAWSGAMDDHPRSAMANATEAKVPLAQWVAEKRLVAPAHLAAANAIEFGMPLIDVTAFDPAHNAVKLVSEELIQKHQVLPLFKRGASCSSAPAIPPRPAALTEIQFHTNLVVEPVLVDDDQLRRTLDQWLNAASNLSGTFGGDDDEGLDNLEVGADDDMGAGSDDAVDGQGR